MAAEWQKMPFDEAVLLNPQVSLEAGGTYPYVEMRAVEPSYRDVSPSANRKFMGGGSRFCGGDTLMARITPCLENGKIARFRGPLEDSVGHGSTEFIVIRGREGVTNNDFAYYLTRSEYVQNYAISQMSGTSGRQRVPTNALAHLQVSIPPLPEQRAIAHILSSLDDKIELNRKMNETLGAIARAIFRSWFVDFNPVRAKAEGRDTGLPKKIADLFSDRFKDSELGEIPAGWQIKTIGDIAECVRMGPFGSSIKVETFVANGIPIISGQHLASFILEDSTFNFIADAHAEKLYAANVRRGDIIFTHAGNIGQVAFIPANSRYERYIISQRQFYMRCDLLQVSPSFITFYFQSREGRHKLLANTSSSGVPSIARPVTYLKSIELIVPPKPALDAYENLFNSLLFQYQRNLNESFTLSALRDTLLPKLVSGDLRLRDAEKSVLEI